jgi:glycosyltransferase involved in cell wall biosynthesis
VLCTYNGERFLQAQIDSLLQQTYSNIEIIISDDHSVDGTRSILQQYDADKKFLITYQPQNLGAIHNFAYVTRQATGEFIAFCDQDDIWLPEKIQKLHSAIGDQLLIYSDSILIDEDGQSLQKNLSQLRKMGDVKDSRGFIFSNVVWGHAMMINRKLLPIPAGIPHDIWFAFKATTITGIKYLNEPLTLYRQHSTTVTTTIARKTGTRPYEKRYKDFEEKIYWITLMRDHEPGETKSFYVALQKLYYRKNKGQTVWPLFWFMLKHQAALFQFTYKNRLSRLIEIKKQSRGEWTK